MKFSKMFRFDLAQGLTAMWKVFLWQGLLVSFLIFDFTEKTAFQIAAFGTTRTLGDFALYAFGGMKPYIPSPNEPFRFPALWMLVFSLVCFSTLCYPFQDLHGYGRNLIVAWQSRYRWYLSKCLWCAFVVSISFVLYWTIILFACGITHSSFSFHISSYMTELFEWTDNFNSLDSWRTACVLVCGPWLTALSLTLLQLAVSIHITPLLGFCVSASILIMSAHYTSPLFIGNYGMIIRDNQFLMGGMCFEMGVACNLLLSGLSGVTGLYLFRRYNIIEKGDVFRE